MTHEFRFGVQLSSLPGRDWRDRIRSIERLGYSSVFWPRICRSLITEYFSELRASCLQQCKSTLSKDITSTCLIYGQAKKGRRWMPWR